MTHHARSFADFRGRRIALAALSLSCGTALAQPLYHYVELPLPPGCNRGGARGVNEVGNVVGYGIRSNNTCVGFFYERETGTMHHFELGNSTASLDIGPHAINDNNEVVGIRGSGLSHPFYWTPSDGLVDILFTPYEPPVSGNIHGSAYAINNQGIIAGHNIWNCASSPTFGVLAAVMWPHADEEPAPIIGTPFPCGVGGQIYGMSNAGEICGQYRTVGASGFQWDRPIVVGGTSARYLPTFGGPEEHGYARDANDAGVPVGFAENRTSSGPTNGACYWIGNTIHRLNGIPAAAMAIAYNINNSMDIVGTNLGPSNDRRAVLWKNLGPTPIDLNAVTHNRPSGMLFSTADEISETGYIVGIANELSGGRPFLLEPCEPTIIAFSGDEELDPGETLELEVVAGGAGPLSYQWYHKGIALVDGLRPDGSTVHGSTEATLTIEGVVPANTGTYRVLVTSVCGEAFSPPAEVEVERCPTDFDYSGFVDLDDFGAFLSAFEGGLEEADYDQSGFVDLDDYTTFVSDFEEGC
jgi:uncharacterized membrane protein